MLFNSYGTSEANRQIAIHRDKSAATVGDACRTRFASASEYMSRAESEETVLCDTSLWESSERKTERAPIRFRNFSLKSRGLLLD
jgi:hypothetical protein